MVGELRESAKTFSIFLDGKENVLNTPIDFNSNSIGQWLMIMSLMVPVQMMAPSENNPPTPTPHPQPHHNPQPLKKQKLFSKKICYILSPALFAVSQ